MITHKKQHKKPVFCCCCQNGIKSSRKLEEGPHSKLFLLVLVKTVFMLKPLEARKHKTKNKVSSYIINLGITLFDQKSPFLSVSVMGEGGIDIHPDTQTLGLMD